MEVMGQSCGLVVTEYLISDVTEYSVLHYVL